MPNNFRIPRSHYTPEKTWERESARAKCNRGIVVFSPQEANTKVVMITKQCLTTAQLPLTPTTMKNLCTSQYQAQSCWATGRCTGYMIKHTCYVIKITFLPSHIGIDKIREFILLLGRLCDKYVLKLD